MVLVTQATRGTGMKKLLIGMVVASALTSGVHAATFNVTRTDDPVPDGCTVNDCSLREAVIAADQTITKDFIVLPAGTHLIDLSGSDSSENVGDLDISTDMEFVGAPSAIDGQNLGRIMDISSDANVTLRDLTLQNANTSLATNGSLNGGAIEIGGGSLTLDTITLEDNSTQSLGGAVYAFDDAVVIIENCSFINNRAGDGAGVFASTGITVRDTLFQNNRADLNALGNGAVYLSGTSSDALFEDVTFDNNLSTGPGGAIQFLGRNLLIDGLIATSNKSTNRSGGVISVPGTAHVKQVEIVNALFESNMAEDSGGAMTFADDDDVLDISHSSFVSNTAGEDGGALYLTGGMVNLTNNTFSGNQATDDGGGIYMFGAVLTATHVTFSGNQASTGNDLAMSSLSSNSVVLANNLFDGNCFIGDTNLLTSLGGNVEGNGNTCDLDFGSDLVNQSDVQLGLLPLANNPGGTPTHKLTAASVARGQGEMAICSQVGVDQLYENRGMCNSGADESDTIFHDGFESN